MNFRFTLCFFLLVVTGSLFAQKSIRLQHDFQPETTYASEMTMDMDMTMNIKSGPDGDPIPEGTPDSTNMDMLIDIASRQLFGARRPDGGIGFEMKYDSMTQSIRFNGKEEPMPPSAADYLKDMSIIGSIHDGEMRVDSIGGMALDSATAVAMKSNLQGLQIMIDFPDRPLMAGDTFSQTREMTTSAGVAGQLAFIVHQQYRLDRWDEQYAYLTLTEQYDFSSSVSPEGVQLDGRGGGKGRVVFSIEDKTATEYETDSNMIVNMDMMGMIMSMDTKNKILMKNRIVR